MVVTVDRSWLTEGTSVISPSAAGSHVSVGTIIMDMNDIDECSIDNGYCDSVCCSVWSIYVLTPFESDAIRAMPMIPMEPAKATSIVLAFLVQRLLKLKTKDVRKLIDALPRFLWTGAAAFALASSSKGSLSSMMRPSLTLTILVAYSSASSGLCVTITTRRSFATSFKRFMTWILVSVSRAPVGSSARRMSGSFTRALAMATLCIWPPDIWLGFLWACSRSPTFSNASRHLCLRSLAEIPEIVRASSTFERTVW